MRLTLAKTKVVDVPNDPDMGFINIVGLDMETLSFIESKAMIISMTETGTAASLDTHKRINDVAKACITGWGNMFDSAGKELKFNPKNLQEAAKLSISIDNKEIRFFEWVDREHTKFLTEIKEGKSEAAKN